MKRVEGNKIAVKDKKTGKYYSKNKGLEENCLPNGLFKDSKEAQKFVDKNNISDYDFVCWTGATWVGPDEQNDDFVQLIKNVTK